ncbi:hypothetical protein BKA62DRAFT_711983 [Auriculariales sp. MPI-PUGE-AT-0066]|nr:hypothetical protein BKA62DRAFT_711983 [Auriculariales sp. MPI-PUGE-AT-0066]
MSFHELAVAEAVSMPTPTVHRDFALRADVALHSGDGVLFHVWKRDLTRTSIWFQEQFNTAPLPEGQMATFTLPETSATLELVLKMALGLAAPSQPMLVVDNLQLALAAAAEYKMPGVTQNLLQYVLACKYGLEELRVESLERCIGVELDFQSLASLDVAHLARLLAEKQSRAQDLQCVLSSLLPNNPTCPFYELNHGKCCTAHCEAAVPEHQVVMWHRLIRAALCRSAVAPTVEAVLSEPLVTSVERTLLEVPCADGHFPFHDIRRRLLSGMEALAQSKSTA